MSRVVVLGAGVSGHTAAAFARVWLGREHDVTVVSPRDHYNWIPSNIWVGVGLMRPEKVVFPLRPVYERHGIEFVQAAASELHPEGDAGDSTPFVVTDGGERVPYDFLVNATGPRLRFDKTEGLGPEAWSLSVCTADHAAQAAAALAEAVERMRHGERQRFLVGTGHGTCTCEGAAFEYVVNLEFELRARGVRDKAEIMWITNEYELGDFGMGGMQLRRGGYVTPSSIFTASLFAERGIDWITRAHVRKVEPRPGLLRDGRRRRGRAGVRLRDAAAAVLRRGHEGVRPCGRRDHRARLPAERVHARRRRLHAEAVRGVARRRLAAHLPVARVSERVRGRDRVRPAPRRLAAVRDPERRAGRPSPAAYRNAVGDDRQGGRRARSST